MSGGTIFKVRAQVHVKKTRKFLSFELATVTSQALKYDVINFCLSVFLFKHFYSKFYKPATTLTTQPHITNFIQNLISPQRPYLHNTLDSIRIRADGTCFVGEVYIL